MNDKFLNYILKAVSAKEWKVRGLGIGDNFDSVVNDSKAYKDSKRIKGFKGITLHRSESSNEIEGIFLPIPFFENQPEKVLSEIKNRYGQPYFEHLRMEDRMLYYRSFDFIICIIQDDISKGLCISIGECGARLQTFSAENIIDTYVGLLSPNLRLFELKKDTPKYTRLIFQSLKSLLLAFIGDDDLKRFEYGKFILESNDQYVTTLMKKLGSIEIFRHLKAYDSTIITDPKRREIDKYWDKLFRYYVRSTRYIQLSSSFNYYDWKKNELNELKILQPRKEVEAKIKSLKNILCQIIDPDQKTIDIKVMIEEFGYPKEDLALMKLKKESWDY